GIFSTQFLIITNTFNARSRRTANAHGLNAAHGARWWCVQATRCRNRPKKRAAMYTSIGFQPFRDFLPIWELSDEEPTLVGCGADSRAPARPVDRRGGLWPPPWLRDNEFHLRRRAF